MRRTITTVLALTLVLGIAGTALAATGDLDPTFGTEGSTAPVPDQRPTDVALQSDGSILAVGWSSLARWTTDGMLDSSFGSSGIAATYGPGQELAVQQQGSAEHLLVTRRKLGEWEYGGRVQNSTIGVDRYLESGSHDGTFSASVAIDDGAPWPADLEVQADGRIIQGIVVRETALTTCFMTTCVYDPRGSWHMLVRYNPDGGLDRSFGDKGVLRLDAAVGETNWGGLDVAIQPDGRLVTATTVDTGVLVRRFQSDGTPDVTFVPVTIPHGEGFPEAPALGIDAAGNIVAAAVTCANDYDYAGECNIRVQRLQADGRRDPSFTQADLSSARLLELEIDSSGGVLLIDHERMTRLTPTGEVDETFGSNGSVSVANLRAAELQSDGKIVVVRATARHSDGNAMVVSRYLASGDAIAPVPPPTLGAIAGSIATRSGSPVAGAVIDCGPGGAGTSSSDGAYQINDVPEGSFDCTATASGYRPQKQRVTVIAGETTTANFVLQATRR